MTYNYSKKFKHPHVMVDINLENPLMRLPLQIYDLLQYKKAMDIKLPNNIRRRHTTIPSFDGYNISCFIYEPIGYEDKVIPTIFYLHGGGFIMQLSSLMINNAIKYVNDLKCRVIMPEYRLAWKYPFPIPLEDCFSIYNYFTVRANLYHLDTNKIVIYGDSAGGCLAAGLTQLIIDRNLISPCGQMLIYPVIDNDKKHKSKTKYKNSVWKACFNNNMWNLYLKNTGPLKYAVPILYDKFDKLPCAYIEPAQIDVLCDEAISYHKKLQRHQVSSILNIIEGGYHGFDYDHSNQNVIEIINYRCDIMSQMFNHKL